MGACWAQHSCRSPGLHQTLRGTAAATPGTCKPRGSTSCGEDGSHSTEITPQEELHKHQLRSHSSLRCRSHRGNVNKGAALPWKHGSARQS